MSSPPPPASFNCPMCKNQMKQIHFGKGMPNIKLQFDLGDGTPGTIVTFCSCGKGKRVLQVISGVEPSAKY